MLLPLTRKSAGTPPLLARKIGIFSACGGLATTAFPSLFKVGCHLSGNHGRQQLPDEPTRQLVLPVGNGQERRGLTDGAGVGRPESGGRAALRPLVAGRGGG